MARIFRQRYTVAAKDGRRVTRQSRNWYIEYRAADGVRRRVPGFADKAATLQLAATLEREAEQRKAGLIDRYAAHRKRPLLLHLEDYEQHQRARAISAQHLANLIPRARKVLIGAGCTYWGDLSASKVQTYVAEIGEAGRSIQTCNFYLGAVKGFCQWMVRDGRAPENPLAHLQGGNARTDRRHDRRAFTDEDLRHLLATTRAGPVRCRMTGPERALLYQLAVETGLRASELLSLTWGSFDLAGNPPIVTVAAAYSKHRRQDILPLRPCMAGMLACWRDSEGSVDSAALVFARATKRLVTILRPDLAAAGIAYRDGSGRVADFHALRHTFITNLARGGVHPKQAQDLARHSTIGLTLDRYTHTVLPDQAAALAVLPDLSRQSELQVQQATGTDAGKVLPTSLPKILPISLPRHPAPDGVLGAPRCKVGSVTGTRHQQETPMKQGANGASVQPAAPQCSVECNEVNHVDVLVPVRVEDRAGQKVTPDPASTCGSVNQALTGLLTENVADPDLVAVIQAWPHLSRDDRSDVLRMVKACV